MCEMCDLAMASAAEQPPVRTRYRVAGVQGATCAAKIEAVARRVPGVLDVSVSATAGEMTVHHAVGTSLGDAVEKAVAGLGYQLSFMPEPEADRDARDSNAGGRSNPHRTSWFRDILDIIAGRGRSAIPMASAGRSLER